MITVGTGEFVWLQSSMTASNSVSFKQPELHVTATVGLDGAAHVDVRALATNGAYMGGVALSFTKDEIDTFTGTGNGDTTKYLSAIQQAVVGYLEGLSENSSTTFTIS